MTTQLVFLCACEREGGKKRGMANTGRERQRTGGEGKGKGNSIGGN